MMENNWFHHSKQSTIIPSCSQPFKVSQRKGDRVVLVDEMPIPGNFRDYSIRSLTEANIPLEKTGNVASASEMQFMNALNELEQINTQKNEN